MEGWYAPSALLHDSPGRVFPVRVDGSSADDAPRTAVAPSSGDDGTKACCQQPARRSSESRAARDRGRSIAPSGQREEGRGALPTSDSKRTGPCGTPSPPAQIAFVRANYTDAALKLREAETAQPGWIITAPDIQSIFGEPTEFARHIAKLETHLQSHPDDRDAWLVLGAEWFLTGRTAKAADVFQRLNDPKRKPDVALAAFLDASNQVNLRPPNLPGRPLEPPK